MTTSNTPEPDDGEVVVAAKDLQDLALTVAGLGGRVRSLSNEVSRYADIAARQEASEREARAAQQAAALAQAGIQRLGETALTREEQEAKEAEQRRQALIRERQRRRRNRIRAGIVAAVLLAVGAVIAVIAHYVVKEHRDFQDLRAGLESRCEATNKQTSAQVNFSQALDDLLTGHVPGQPPRPVSPQQKPVIDAATKAFNRLAASQPRAVDCHAVYGSGR